METGGQSQDSTEKEKERRRIDKQFECSLLHVIAKEDWEPEEQVK